MSLDPRIVPAQLGIEVQSKVLSRITNVVWNQFQKGNDFLTILFIRDCSKTSTGGGGYFLGVRDFVRKLWGGVTDFTQKI
jgi:hypothetical protein